MMPRAAHEPPPDARAAAGWGTLTPATSWGGDDAARPGEPVEGARDAVEAGRPDALADYQPPFEVTADLLVVPALCPTAPLRRAFPSVPFLSLLGRTPLLAWFGRVTEGCAYDADGRWRCEGGRGAVLYHELTVVAALARRALFLPATYATSARSVRLARHYYGMPKDPAVMTLRVAGRRFAAAAWSARGGVALGTVWARPLGSGLGVARLASFLWPLRVWPVRFPAGTAVRGAVLAAPSLRPALVPAGRLTIGAPRRPLDARLLPLGLYAADLRLRLPRPAGSGGPDAAAPRQR
jgi:hypothetical protein